MAIADLKIAIFKFCATNQLLGMATVAKLVTSLQKTELIRRREGLGLPILLRKGTFQVVKHATI